MRFHVNASCSRAGACCDEACRVIKRALTSSGYNSVIMSAQNPSLPEPSLAPDGVLRLSKRSLALRWMLLVSVVASLGVGGFLYIASRELDRRIEQESTALLALGQEKMVERLDGEVMLANQRLAALFSGLEEQLDALAGMPATAQALRQRDGSKLAELVGKRLQRAGFSGGLMLDQKRSIIGAQQPGFDLAAAQSALNLHELDQTLHSMLETPAPFKPKASKFIGVFDHALAGVFLTPEAGRYGMVIAAPVFDEFGQPAGALLGFRMLRGTEAVLADFARVTKSGIALMQEGVVHSVAGSVPFDIAPGAADQAGLLHADAQGLVGRCAMGLPALSTCVFRSGDEITGARDAIISIATQQTREVAERLLWVGLATVLLMIALLSLLTHGLTRPLQDITKAVHRVAEGEWQVDVKHADRQDEIGAIAREIAAMQVALVARDTQRQDALRQDVQNRHRLLLEVALARFEEKMAGAMQAISTTLQGLSAANERIGETIREAGREAERIAAPSRATAQRAARLGTTAAELNTMLADMGDCLNAARIMVARSSDDVAATATALGDMSGLARNSEDQLGLIQGFIADIGHVALQASLEVLKLGEAGSAFLPLTGRLNDLTRKTAEAMALISGELGQLAVVAEGTSTTFEALGSAFSDTLEKVQAITAVADSKKAAAMMVGADMLDAASAIETISASIDTLRLTMTGAHQATSGFVHMARRIVDDAKAVDDNVQRFMREALA